MDSQGMKYGDMMREVDKLAAAGDWVGVSDFIFTIHNPDVAKDLCIYAERKPGYMVQWPEDSCLQFEEVYGKTCPYRAGTLSVIREMPRVMVTAESQYALPCPF